MTGVLLCGTDLTETDLIQTQIDLASGDGATNLPPGIEKPTHWNGC